MNFDKLTIYFSRNISSSRRSSLVDFFRVPLMSREGKYLGTHLLMDQFRRASYDFSLNKFTPKLKGWNSKMLSQARTDLS